jgi:hypothetical protein
MFYDYGMDIAYNFPPHFVSQKGATC